MKAIFFVLFMERSKYNSFLMSMCDSSETHEKGQSREL